MRSSSNLQSTKFIGTKFFSETQKTSKNADVWDLMLVLFQRKHFSMLVAREKNIKNFARLAGVKRECFHFR